MKKIKNIVTSFIIIIYFFSPFISLAEDKSNCHKMFDMLGATERGTQKANICYYSPTWVIAYQSDLSWILSELLKGSKSDAQKRTGIKALGVKGANNVFGVIGVSTFFTKSALGGFFENFKTLTQDKHIIRDRNNLTNLETQITDYAMDIFGNSMIYSKINESTRKKIEDYTKNVNRTYFLLNIQDNTTYIEVIKTLWENQILLENIFYEKIVTLSSTSSKEKNKELVQKVKNKLKLEGGNYALIGTENEKTNLFYLLEEFNKVYFNYSKNGSSLNKTKCSDTWSTLVTSMKSIICDVGGSELKEATNRFSCNYVRLLSTIKLSGTIRPFNCGSTQIEPWTNYKDRLEVNGDLNDAVSTIKEIGSVGKVLYDSEGAKNSNKKQIEETQAVEQETRIQTYTKNINPFVDSMNSITEEIIKDLEEINTIYTNIEPSSITHGITELFPQISKNVYETTKITELIYNNTEYTCEQQSPQQGDCSAN